MGKLLKVCKGYAVSVILFILLTVIAALVFSVTELPMKHSNVFMIIAVTIAAMLFGFFAGGTFEKRGLIVGVCSGCVYVATIVFAVTTALGSKFAGEMMSAVYIIPVILSGISGAAGTNLKS